MLRSKNSIQNPANEIISIFRNLDGAVYYKTSDGKAYLADSYHDVYRIENPKFKSWNNLTDETLNVLNFTDSEFIFSLSDCNMSGGIGNIGTISGGGRGGRGSQGSQGSQGAQGAQGASGGASNPNLFANALFVDAQFGNDTNAVPFSLMDNTDNPTSHKYQTIGTALAAANSGDVIIVYPGTYIEGNLWKDGITFYFYPCDVRCNFIDSNGNESMKVFGNARFTNNPGDAIIDLSDGTSLYFQFDTMVSSGTAIQIRDNQVTLRGNKIQAANAGVITNGNTSFADIRIFVSDFIKSTGAGGRALNMSPDSFGGNIFIETEEIISTGFITTGAISILCGGVSGGGTLTINANRITTTNAQVASASNTVIQIAIQGGKVIINGNIFCSNANTIGITDSAAQDNFNNSEFIFNGNIDVQDSAIILANGHPLTGIYRFNGKFIGENSALGVGYEGVVALNSSAGDTMKLFFNGEINNRVANGNGIKKSNVSDPDVILDTVKILTTGTGQALISDTLADTYKTIFVSARKQTNTNMTNSIVGSIDYQDSNIE